MSERTAERRCALQVITALRRAAEKDCRRTDDAIGTFGGFSPAAGWRKVRLQSRSDSIMGSLERIAFGPYPCDLGNCSSA